MSLFQRERKVKWDGKENCNGFIAVTLNKYNCANMS